MSKPHPMQPVELDDMGVLRFRRNAIVDKLLEFGQAHGYGLHEIAGDPFPTEDRIQFAQLIGYSVSGFGDLSYVDDVTVATADRVAELGETPEEARLAVLANALIELQDGLRAPMAALFGVHPDDLRGCVDAGILGGK